MDNEEQQAEGLPKKRFNLKPKVVLIVLAVMVIAGIAGVMGMTQLSKNPAFCGTCHIIKPYYQSWKGGNLLAGKHAAKGVSCLDCHHKSYIEKAEEGVRYITGTYSKPLKEIAFTREQCLQCHGKDFDKVVSATNFEESNPHDSHLGEMECTQCHKMHSKSEIYCAQCHQFGWFEKLDDGWNRNRQI